MPGPGTGTQNFHGSLYQDIYITTTPTLVYTKWQLPDKISIPSKHPSIFVFFTTIYKNPGHGGILKKYLDKSKHLYCLPQSAGAGAFAFLEFWGPNAHTHFFNFTPGLLPIFEFWGPLLPIF